jgi:tRNA nucleotidyltransferase (CCA-adding enzyme)
VVVAQFHGKLHAVSQMKPSTILHFLMELDAIRQPQRFELFLQACEADSRGRTGLEQCPLPDAEILKQALVSVMQVDAGKIAKTMTHPDQIKQAVFEARLAALTQSHVNN